VHLLWTLCINWVCLFVGCEDDGLSAEDEANDIAHDQRRWELADVNNDDMLDKQEFSNFVHPEEAPHMRESLIEVLTNWYVILVDWHIVCGISPIWLFDLSLFRNMLLKSESYVTFCWLLIYWPPDMGLLTFCECLVCRILCFHHCH